ncbi:MAG TPA: Vms1/Ankzf1 family peptidyl-tRNA hydrolase, partial [Dehalococcoidia bacterium]|nr:Vms1/Ankzf1 family peptidyl-tRNA hydrolase [Dehalococcoidia bacterium]
TSPRWRYAGTRFPRHPCYNRTETRPPATMIISPEFVQRLAAQRSPDGVLSVYLRIDPALLHVRHHPVAEFKAALKLVNGRPEEERPPQLRREAERVLRYLEEDWRPEGKGLAIFASNPLNLWEVVPLHVSLPNAVYFADTPSVHILAALIDEYERYATVVVDKEDAHLYIIHMGEIERQAEVFDPDVPGRHDQGGWAQARYQRHTGFHVHEHLKHVLQRLERYYYAQPFDRLILGGPEEALGEFEKMLPPVLRERLIGTFHVAAKSPPQEILARAATVFEAYERAQEETLVSRIIDNAEAGGPGVVGLAPTIEALNEGRVHQLVVADGVTAAGAECLNCGLLIDRPGEPCPACGAATCELPDLVERAVQRVYENNGGVEVVFARAAEWLESRGGIAAELRF